MSPSFSSPKVLLLHDSELHEARDLLNDLGVSFVERIGCPTGVDKKADWDVVIASEKRVRWFDPKKSSLKTLRIAIIDNDSRTLRSLLRCLGVNFVVARPVHASALRLLVLHALYRGSERRKQTRVSVGAPIQIRAGLRKRDALLADLSLQGAQLICRSPIKEGGGSSRSSSRPRSPRGRPLASLDACCARASTRPIRPESSPR
jgi:hypothetical protein